MPNERAVEIPWVLSQLPQSGLILDVGSCYASYLEAIIQDDRILHCIDPQDCGESIPARATFFRDSLIGNRLMRNAYDCVLVVSTLEHIGLAYYGQMPFERGDVLAVAEIWDLLKPGGCALFTVPAGKPKTASWYRQYNPQAIHDLFPASLWQIEVTYWGFQDDRYVEIPAEEVEDYDYRELDGARYHASLPVRFGAGAVAGIVATKTAGSR